MILKKSKKKLKNFYYKPYDEKIIKHLKELKNFLFYPNVGNLGDVIIAQSEYQMLDSHNFNYRIHNAYIPDNQPDNDFNVVYGGGGLFVGYWNYEKVLSLFSSKHLKKAVILPSSFRNCDDLMMVFDERFTVFCREKESYNYCVCENSRAKFYCADDMSFSLNININKTIDFNKNWDEIKLNKTQSMFNNLFFFYKTVHNNIVDALRSKTEILKTGYRLAYFLRTDKEKAINFTNINSIDLSIFANNTCTDKGVVALLSDLFIRSINTVDVIVTDRLHIGIVGAILGKKILFFDNVYGKISGVYNMSMKEMKNVDFLTDIKQLHTHDFLKYNKQSTNFLYKRIFFLDFYKIYKKYVE